MKLRRALYLFLAAFAAGNVNAALINFTGNIEYHNDVIYTYFTLDNDATDVRIWTDSFQNGGNFDPITALWNSAGTLIQENDDNSAVNPSTQTIFDSGFILSALDAGDYLFTVSVFPNFALGSSLSDGFSFDGQEPVLLADWYQGNEYYSGDVPGNYWSVWLDGVDSAYNPGTTSVPEPAPLALLGIGLVGLLAARKRKPS